MNYNLDADLIKKNITSLPMVFLEDESGRVELDISSRLEYLWVTGVTIGLRGVASSNGKFLISDIVEAGLAPQPKRLIQDSLDTPKFVALVSGLHYGSTNHDDFSFQRSQFLEFLSGKLHVNI